MLMGRELAYGTTAYIDGTTAYARWATAHANGTFHANETKRMLMGPQLMLIGRHFMLRDESLLMEGRRTLMGRQLCWATA